MKQNYLFTALLAGTLLAGCSQNETISDMIDNGQIPVEFSTYIGKTTNRAAVKTDFANGDAIGLFAYYTTLADYTGTNNEPANFMFDQVVTKGADNSWSYSPVKYWPNYVNSNNERGKVSFFAYYPMATHAAIALDATFGTNKIGDPKIVYTASTQANQVDLLWGVDGDTGLPYLDQIKPTGTTDKITFTFKHALARVGFNIKLADDIINADASQTTVTIDKIEFGGTLATTSDKEGALTPSLTPSATLNLNNTTARAALWESPATTNLYQLLLETADFTDNGKFGGTGNAELSAEITNNNDKHFMIIPQDFSSTKTQMRVTYTVTTTDAAVNGEKSEVTNKHVADVSTKFENGKIYTYTINIGLTSVKVDAPTITPWEDGTQPTAIETK